MTGRFDDLRKLPAQPAVRLLAGENARLATRVPLPASAGVAEVMAHLDGVGAHVDMLRLMSVALPPRERAWWACLAGRDMIGAKDKVPLPLERAEAWVRRPSDAARAAARDAADIADVDDETVLCATVVIFCDDRLGPGDLAQYPGPPGAGAAAAFAMNVKALATGRDIGATARVLVDRALDIARGGNGRIPLPAQVPEEDAS